MSFEEFYETWWLDHENNVLAPTPKEAMRQAWLAGRKAEKAAQHSVKRTSRNVAGSPVILDDTLDDDEIRMVRR